MFFSVIVPVYKVEEYLENCINSVLGQTFGDFELILVDDGSPDACPVICDRAASADSRIKVIHKPNGGLASARQAGIREAEGDYVYNLDSDDAMEKDTLECAHKIITDTGCDIVSFAYKWVENGKVTAITNDTADEGYYGREAIREHIFPKLLMDKSMNHVAYYLAGKAIRRELLLPVQLGVSPEISLGEDLCCVVPCYLKASGVYISKKAAYLYTKRSTSISKKFNSGQIYQIQDVINEVSGHVAKMGADFDAQLSRYSCFMCFAILAAAAEGNHFESINEIKQNIKNSVHASMIKKAEFQNITLKSRISIFLMKKGLIGAAFYFLNFCKRIRNLLKKG